MKYKNLFLVSLGLLSIFKVSLSFADGLFMSSEHYHGHHLYSPEQKAIVTWDGKTEQMVLASKVRTDKISNMVWIIPIQSRIKPEVQKSDFSIFKDLIFYFGEKEQGRHVFGRDLGMGKSATEGVEVIETKKVDIYDIAILKATSTNDLLLWLNANGYQVLMGAKPTIEKYTQRPSMYFVANKIDLRNRFNADLKQAQDFYEGMRRRLEQKQQTDQIELNSLQYVQYQPLFGERLPPCSAWQMIEDEAGREKVFSACVIEKVKTRLQQTGKAVQTVSPDPHFLNTYILSIDAHWTVTFSDFDRVADSYFFLQYSHRIILTDMFPRKQGRDMARAKYFPPAIGQEAVTYADMIRAVLTEELALKKNWDERSKERKDISMVLSALSQWSRESFFCNYRYFQDNFPDGDRRNIMLEAASGISPDPEVEKTDYCQTIAALQAGMATPLKISFEPDTPYYPLEISSLGEGSAMVDVYVIADGAVSDQNKVFQEVKPLALNGMLKEKIIKEFQAGPWGYVTRFTWGGRLEGLKKDAVFVRD